MDETRMADIFWYFVVLGDGYMRVHYIILCTLYIFEIFPKEKLFFLMAGMESHS